MTKPNVELDCSRQVIPTMPGLRGVYSTTVLLPLFVILFSSHVFGAPKPAQAGKAVQPAPAAPAAIKARPDWLPPNPNDYVLADTDDAPPAVQYYEEPGQRPVEQDLEALTAGTYPYPAFVGLNENGLEELPTMVGADDEAMISQDFSDMPSVVAESGDDVRAGVPDTMVPGTILSGHNGTRIFQGFFELYA